MELLHSLLKRKHLSLFHILARQRFAYLYKKTGFRPALGYEVYLTVIFRSIVENISAYSTKSHED